MAQSTILNDFLTALGVKHTADYTNQQCQLMPFQSLFGIKKLLESYKIDSDGYQLADKTDIANIPVPFIAQLQEGLVIVTSVSNGDVEYLSQSVEERITVGEFVDSFTGNIFVAKTTKASIEPGYKAHHLVEIASVAKKYALYASAVVLFAYLFVTAGLYKNVSTIALTLVNLAGLWLCFNLVKKSLNIKTAAADRVCGILEEGGCDHILSLKASTFFGIVKWSEVGFAYYLVSTLCLLIFPQFIGYLALINLCCLPFTVWSIWYQKFRAKAWCTLCVSVQLSLWLEFLCYLLGGWYHYILPLKPEIVVLGLTYLFVLLAIDHISPLLDKTRKEYDTTTGDNNQ